ncbi:MAG TPA: hypothetical protein VG675_05055 [Bryobacteraceae bacterium]|nr:hypothetical protein [Bryobacteraceae bacterium]
MTEPERIHALREMGYGERESRFLLLAALHSGYFVRRQFLDFTAGSKGRCDSEFVAKLEARNHCRETVFRHGRALYRLCSKPFFAALGEADNRNRREKQPSTIKNRLMALDFVLAHPESEYLPTECDKVQYFHSTGGVALDRLPSRRYRSATTGAVTVRYFVDKFPIFLSPAPDPLSAAAGTRRVVHFCYVDEGLGSADGFETHLAQYGPLLEALEEFRWVYVATNTGALRRAEAIFVASRNGRGKARSAPADPAERELIDYFEARRKYEAKDFSGFDTARVIRYREEKRRFSGDEFEMRYRHWLVRQGAEGDANSSEQPRAARARGSQFLTYELRHDYDLFGA